MRRLEYVGGSSQKFREAFRDDMAVTVRWGRIGTAGQSKRTEFGDGAAAQAFVVTQAAEKLRKGCTEVGNGTGSTPTAVADPASTSGGVAEAATVPAPVAEGRAEVNAESAPVAEPVCLTRTRSPAAALVRAAYPRRDQASPSAGPTQP